MPNMPIDVIMAEPKGCFVTPRDFTSRFREFVSHEENRIDGRRNRLGIRAMLRLVLANSLSSPRFMWPARSRSSRATSNTDLSSARSTFTPDSCGSSGGPHMAPAIFLQPPSFATPVTPVRLDAGSVPASGADRKAYPGWAPPGPAGGVGSHAGYT